MKRKLISIIIPVYKTEQYLKRCVDSVLNQTYQELECILVDDGSPDEAGKICDEYKKKDAQKYSGIHNKKICENVCIKNGLIVPYLSVEFPVEAIKRVTMSPITETEITKSGIKEFFRINNIPTSIPVYQSKIPIRY